MKNDTLEHLSSLMDGELSQETGLFVARRMSADSELGQTWERYHLIRECLRRPGGKWSALSLSVDVEAVQPVAIEPPRRWLKPLSGLAIAASVAAMAVLVVVPGTAPQITPETAATQPFTSPNSINISPASEAASFSGGSDNQRLNSYLLRHNQVAGSVGGQGFISLVPIVTNTPVQVLKPVTEQGEVAAQEEAVSAPAATQP